MRSEQVVLVKRDRVRAAARGDRLKHVAHRAEALGVALVAHAAVAERGHVVAVLVRRAIVQQRDLEVRERLREHRRDAAARLRELVIAGDVDRDPGHAGRTSQLPISHSCAMTKSPSLIFAMPCPVLNRSHRPMVNPMALAQKSQRSLFPTPTVKLSAYEPSVSGSGPSRQTTC